MWIYLVWNECYDDACELTLQRKLYLSRSTDGGYTFEHVLQFNGYFSLNNYGPANPVFFIEKDNTMYFLRDSSIYNGSFTEFYLIYSKIPRGDLTKRTEAVLPKEPDSLETTGHFFIIPSDNKPLCVISTYTRPGYGSDTYYFYTKCNDAGVFSYYKLIDSLSNDGLAKINLFHFNENKIHLKYLGDKI